ERDQRDPDQQPEVVLVEPDRLVEEIADLERSQRGIVRHALPPAAKHADGCDRTQLAPAGSGRSSWHSPCGGSGVSQERGIPLAGLVGLLTLLALGIIALSLMRG